MIDTSIMLCGVKLKSPLILASGILGVTASSLADIASNGAGAVTTKSIGKDERMGHPSPMIAEFDAGMLNCVGLSNPGAKDGVDIVPLFRNLSSVPLIISIFGFSIEQIIDVAKIAAAMSPDLIELNLSCPNVAGEMYALDPELSYSSVRAVKNLTKIPLIAKLSPNAVNIVEIAKSCKDAGADILNMGNTIGPGMLIDISLRSPVLSNKFGGISGPAIRPLVQKKVWDIYENVDLPIIGTGGISCWEDAVEMILAGASAISLGTAVYSQGKDIFIQIDDGIRSYMKKYGFHSIGEMVGAAHDG